MSTALTETESKVIELASDAFKTFCEDISGMFGVDILCNQQEVIIAEGEGLKKHFEDFVAVTAVRAEGVLNRDFHLVFDLEGLFILCGVIVMQPEQEILENIKVGCLEKAHQQKDVFGEIGVALVGAWDRVFRKGLDGHGCFVYANSFVGEPQERPEQKIGPADEEECVFVPYKMTIEPYQPFKCGVIFPKTIFTNTAIPVSGKAISAEEKPEEKDTGTGGQTIETGRGDSSNGPRTPEAGTRPAVSSAVWEKVAKDIMQKDVIWGSPEDDVQQALTKIKQSGAGYIMIGRNGIPEGIVSRSDLTGAMSPYLRPEFARWRRPLDDATLRIKVRWVMSSPVVTIRLETSLAEIMENMGRSGRRALPVVDQQGKVQGLVTVFDIFKVLL